MSSSASSPLASSSSAVIVTGHNKVSASHSNVTPGIRVSLLAFGLTSARKSTNAVIPLQGNQVTVHVSSQRSLSHVLVQLNAAI